MEKTTCPIWGTPAEFEMRDDSSRHYNSPRAGGDTSFLIHGIRWPRV